MKRLPELKAEIDRLDMKDALVVIYLDVGDLPPTAAIDYIQRVRKEMGNLPSPMIWIPSRGDMGTRVVAMKSEDVRAIYIDVGDLPPTQAKKYVDTVRRMTKLLPDVPFFPSVGGIPAVKMVDEKEMNENGWYYFGVRPDAWRNAANTLRKAMLDMIDSGKSAGKTREQVVENFAKLTGTTPGEIEAILAGDES